MSTLITKGLSVTSSIILPGGGGMNSVLDTYPPPDGLGIPTGTDLIIYFDREMDLSSINLGTLVLSSPDNASVFGGDLESFQEIAGSDHNNITSALPIDNAVDGTFSFYQADSDGNLLETELTDTTGDGTLWRTVAVFTPSAPLLPNIEYKVILSGDENTGNSFSSGIRRRTVFDPVATVTGTGSLEFGGGFLGTTNQTYTLEIVTGGETGTATYRWWNNASPLTTFEGVTTSGIRKLENGLTVSFDLDGTFVSGDSWEVLCVPFVSIGETASWVFTTGDVNIIEPPSTTSTTGIEVISSGAVSGLLSISEVTPPGGEYGVPISEDPYDLNTIVIEFNTSDVLDSDTFTSNISVVSEAVVDDATATGDLEFTATLSANILTITLNANQLYPNNIVTITLDKDIATEDGVSLGEDYITYFSTPYTPLYADYRRILLDIGPVIEGLSEETIYYAILLASKEADVFSFVAPVNNTYWQFARKQYTTCRAEYFLVNGSLLQGGGDKLSKRLGDLNVSRNGDAALNRLKEDLLECMSLWKPSLENGGATTPDTSLAPMTAVKGATAVDAISVCRQWEPMSSYRVPAANTCVENRNSSSRRRFRSYRKRH